MLKGHVFKEQAFGNQMFALFINTFLNGQNGISNNYKNGMEITYNGSTLTVQSGAVCIQGRLLEEDTSTNITAGTDTMYCKLVIEIDLDKLNTETEFTQASYKVIKSMSGYPELTKNNIVKNNSGIYQYELARFRTTASGIINFQDRRTFLDFESIYDEVRTQIRQIEMGELDLLNKIYPVGSIYISASVTNPSALFGGQWVQIKDTFLLAAGNKRSAGITGGEETHVLTINESPSHNHKMSDYTWAAFTKRKTDNDVSQFYNPGGWTFDYMQTETQYAGGNQAHNNMPPYLTVYMWQRIA